MVPATATPPATNRTASAAAEQPVVEAHWVQAAKDYFAVSVRLARAQGTLEQQVVFISLPNGWTVYLERFSTRKPATVGLIQSGLVGILTEPEWVQPPGSRRWFWPDGEWPEPGAGAAAPRNWTCLWLNLDHRWGFIARGARGFRYEPHPRVEASRGEQWLFLEPPPARGFDADEIIAQRALFVGLNQTAPATAALAKALEAEGQFQTARLYFRLAQWMIDLDFDEPLPQVSVEVR